MRLIIDLDGTICKEEKRENRHKAILLKNAKKSLDKFKKLNHTIIIYTSRGWNEYEMTFKWLKKNKIPFDQLVMGKPIGEYWIDDRAIKFDSWNQINETII